MTDRGKPRVLIADDERVIADTLTMILNRAGYDARAVYDGESAVETARQFEPDLLITDVIMPGINGIETAIQIQEVLPSCRVLLFSGQAATAGLLEKARAEKYEFEILSKPLHPADLLARLRTSVPIPENPEPDSGVQVK